MEFNLKLTAEDIGTLSDALITQPYFKVAELITRLNQQIEEQKVI